MMSDLFNSYTPYDHEVGRVQKVLVTEVSHDGNYYVGHNKSYDQVLVPKDKNLLGKVVEVVITSAGKHYLKCNVLRDVQTLNVPSPLPKGQISGLQDTPLVSSHAAEALGFRHPTWVVMTLSAVILALVARIAIFTFS